LKLVTYVLRTLKEGMVGDIDYIRRGKTVSSSTPIPLSKNRQRKRNLGDQSEPEGVKRLQMNVGAGEKKAVKATIKGTD